MASRPSLKSPDSPDSPTPAPSHRHLRTYVFIALILVVWVADVVFGWHEWVFQEAWIDALRELLDTHPVFAVVIYILVSIVASSLLAVPGVVFAIIAGILFGPWFGTLWCVVATTIGACIAFVLGRYFLQDALAERIESQPLLASWLGSGDSRAMIITLAVTRLVPLFPFNLQNYAYGATSISFGLYAGGTALFIIPGTALYTFAAAGFMDEQMRLTYWALAVICLVLVSAVGVYLRRRYIKGARRDWF